MGIKDIWRVFKALGTNDKDMQAMFRRHATPNACIKQRDEAMKSAEALRAGNEAHKQLVDFIIASNRLDDTERLNNYERLLQMVNQAAKEEQ